MSKAPLQAPLCTLLEETLPEERVQRLWRRLQPKLDKPPRAELSPKKLLALALCVGAAAALVFAFAREPAAPLHLASGAELPSTIQGARTRAMDLDDGSRIEVADGAQLDVLESTARTLVVALRKGRATFNVMPGGPRSWRVECGPVSVEVLGTRFAVERDMRSVRIAVERGRVLVSGEGVPDRVVRLAAGNSLSVPLGNKVSGSSPPTLPHAGSRQPPALGPPAPIDEPHAAPAQRSERAEVAPRTPVSPIPTGTTGLENAQPRVDRPLAENAHANVESLLAQADAARRAGRHRHAAELLHRVVAEHAEDRRVALSEFTLGRLYLESLGQPHRAAVHFSRAIARGLPATLAEDAHARVVEAHARAGNRTEAHRAATRYRSLYPEGHYADDVNRWGSAPAQ